MLLFLHICAVFKATHHGLYQLFSHSLLVDISFLCHSVVCAVGHCWVTDLTGGICTINEAKLLKDSSHKQTLLIYSYIDTHMLDFDMI